MKAMAILSSADSTQQLSLFDPTDYIDNRPAPEIIAARHGFALAFHEDADELPDRRWYAVQDWIKGIAQTDNPRAFWSEMKKRLKKGGIELSTSCLQFPYRAANGKTYKIDHAQADTLYQIVQRMDANTPLRDSILRYLAKAGVRMDQYRRDPSLAVADARRAYLLRGKKESWIDNRFTGKDNRHQFTDKIRDYMLNANYAQLTNAVYEGVLGGDAQTLRQRLGIKRQENLRDALSEVALAYVGIAELVCSHKLAGIGEFEPVPADIALDIIKTISHQIGVQAADMAYMLGIDIVTGQPLLGGAK